MIDKYILNILRKTNETKQHHIITLPVKWGNAIVQACSKDVCPLFKG